jgi:hypothetical protein
MLLSARWRCLGFTYGVCGLMQPGARRWLRCGRKEGSRGRRDKQSGPGLSRKGVGKGRRKGRVARAEASAFLSNPFPRLERAFSANEPRFSHSSRALALATRGDKMGTRARRLAGQKKLRPALLQWHVSSPPLHQSIPTFATCFCFVYTLDTERMLAVAERQRKKRETWLQGVRGRQ